MINIVVLTSVFYAKHVSDSEILCKQQRPYLTLIIEAFGKKFAVPFRTNAHKPKKRKGVPQSVYFFGSSGRSELSNEQKVPALDFCKAVVIEDEDIGLPASIDKQEFQELNSNYSRIVEMFKRYFEFYMASKEDANLKDLPEIKYSALQYFV